MFIEKIFGTQRPTYKDLKHFTINFHEDSKVEFKRSISDNIDKNLLGVVVAFANSEGGVIIIGITDHENEIVGCEENSEQLENCILNRIEPSLAGLFVIETVHIPEGKHVLIVEVERSPELHAVRLKKKEKKETNGDYAYVYYYRSAMSSLHMTPSVLNRISAIKKDLKYNFNYRVALFLRINDLISEILYQINFGRKNKINEDELKSLSEDYLRYFEDLDKSINSDIVKIIRSMRLEFLYRELWEAVTSFYVRILEIEKDIPHTALMFEEDFSLRLLKDVLNFGLNIDSKQADIDSVFNLMPIGLNHEVFYEYRLDMLSARCLFAYMLDYLTPQGYELKSARRKLATFDGFLKNRKNFTYIMPSIDGDEWLTIDDLEKLIREFLETEPDHEDFGVFEKAKVRRGQYLYYATKTFTTMVLRMIELRNYLYDSLSLPIDRNASEMDYYKYLRNSKTSFIYPAYKDLYLYLH